MTDNEPKYQGSRKLSGGMADKDGDEVIDAAAVHGLLEKRMKLKTKMI